MRKSHLIGGILALSVLALAPAVYAQESSNDSTQKEGTKETRDPRYLGPPGPVNQRGIDSLRDRFERGLSLPGQLKEQGDAIRTAVEERQKRLEAGIEGKRATITEMRAKFGAPGKDPAYLGPPIRDDENSTDTDKTMRDPRYLGPPGQAKAGLEERRAAFIEKAEGIRAEFREKLEARRAEIKTIIETRKEEFKARLATFKDETKKTVVARVDENLGKINDRWIVGFTTSIDRINGALAAIESRIDKAEAAGANVTDARDAMAAAEDAISDARAAIEAQAAKDYTIAVEDESTVRSDAADAHASLKADLTAVREAVRAAHDATKAAAQALRAIPGIEVSDESTTTTQ